MATLSGSTTLNTQFAPAIGDFNVQITNGSAALFRRNTTGSPWAPVPGLPLSGAYTVTNSVPGAEYKFSVEYKFNGQSIGVQVQADQ